MKNNLEFPKTPAWPFPVSSKPILKDLLDVYTAPAYIYADTAYADLYDSIGIVHIYDPVYPKGGMTIAYRKSSEFKSGVMVEVAVQVCSEADSFSKKIGNVGAKEKFLNGETIHLPILKMYCEQHIAAGVKSAFTALYNAI